MIIASDLDDCILQTSQSILNLVNKRLNSNHKLKDIFCYNISEAFNLDPEFVGKCVLDALKYSGEIELVQGAIQILNWLAANHELHIVSRRRKNFFDITNANHELHIVSRRRKNFFDITNATLITYGLRNFKLHLSHPEDEIFLHKDTVANNLKVDVFIEDNQDTVMDLYDNVDCNILLMDRPWNRKLKENNKIYRVTNWMEIRDLINIFNTLD